MGLDEELVNRFRDELTCNLCGSLFDNPHLFPGCNHAFCYDCVLQTLEGPGITVSQCPICKQPGWKKELQPAHKLSSLVDHLRTLLIQMGLPLQAEVGNGRSGSEQQQGKKQGNGSPFKPGSRRKAGSKGLLSDSGPKKRKTGKMQQQGAEGREAPADLADGRSARKQVKFADNGDDEAPIAAAPSDHLQESRREEYLFAEAASKQSAEGLDLLGADLAHDLADGAADLADDWDVPNTYPIAPDGCEVLPGMQPPASLIKPPELQPDSAEPRQGHSAAAAPSSGAMPGVAPAAICRSKQQDLSRPKQAQQYGPGGAGAGPLAANGDDDFQEAPGKVRSRGEATGGKQRRQRGVAKEPNLDIKRTGVEHSRKARGNAERPLLEERPARSRAEAKRAQRRQDGVFARMFAAEAALPTEDVSFSPSNSPAAAAASPRARSSRQDPGGRTEEQEHQPESLAPDEVPDSGSLNAEPTAVPAANPAANPIAQHMQLPGPAVGTASDENVQDEVLGTCSAEAGPAEARPVCSAAPAGPEARQTVSAEAEERTSTRDLLRHDPDGPSSAETLCPPSTQQEEAGSLTVPETPHVELAPDQRRSARTSFHGSAAPAHPPQNTPADGGGRAAMSVVDINTLGARLAEQVASPKTAVEADALKQAKEDAERLLAQLQRMCLERGLLLRPEGSGSADAHDGAVGGGGGTDKLEDLLAGGLGAGEPGVGGPGQHPSLLLDTMPLIGTERSLAEIDEAMRARGYRFSTLEDMPAI